MDPRLDCYRQAWISYQEAALISGLSVGHLRNLAHAGRITRRPRGRYRVDRLSLERYLAGELVEA